MKLWSGRFQKETDALVNDFNSSISFDSRLYKEDIAGSLAHAKMLGDCGIISGEDAAAIDKGLREILADIEAGKVEFTADNEDIHMNIETLLTARIGDAGKRLHTARSRNDQVALDFRMYLRGQIGNIIGEILALRRCSAKRRSKTGSTDHARLHAPAAGAAHHLRAAPAGLRRHVQPRRDPARGLPRADERVPAGLRRPRGHDLSHRPLGDRRGARLRRPMTNSLDGVSDRDYALELL
jgi:argininosuccinate lyase